MPNDLCEPAEKGRRFRRDLLALAGVRVASIGPVTSQTAREFGIEVAVEARAFTIDGLVEAMLR